MRPVLLTVRYPESRAIAAKDRQTAPTVGVKLLTTMTSDNGIEQVFEGAIPSRSRACTRPAELIVVFPV